jgi:hypothetical protein
MRDQLSLIKSCATLGWEFFHQYLSCTAMEKKGGKKENIEQRRTEKGKFQSPC